MSSSKIRVLHIIKSLGRGGAETLLPETLKLHDRERYEFFYIYFLPWKDQMADAIRTNGGKVECFRASNNIRIILRMRDVIRYIRKHHIQLIHCHLPWAGLLGRLIYRLTRVPVIYTEHNKQERYHGVTFRLNKLTFNWQSLVIAVSQDVEESIRKNIRPVVPVQTVLNGVNTEAFRRDPPAGAALRAQYNIAPDALVVGTIAVFRFQKRLAEWLDVMAGVCAADSRIYGIIVGDGPLRTEIETKLKELKLEGRVILAGLQTEVRPYLSAMDIYMMSSVFEGLPIALLEAMSVGCAVVTTDAGGIKEVIRDGQDGYLVPVDGWPALGDRVQKLVADPVLRAKLADQARLRATDAFSLKRMVQELEHIYRKLTRQA